jgi:predicted CopG family antitoxin
MRTTLNIDDDVLEAVRQIARAEKKSVGKVMSELVRKAMVEAGLLPAGKAG